MLDVLLSENNTKLYTYDTVSSTSEVAKKLALQSKKNVLVIANEQTNGHGRSGKSFFSPPNTGLYMSLTLCPQELQNVFACLTSYIAVAVCVAIDKLTPFTPKIKWVNDIYMCDKKVCGILVETTVSGANNIPQNIVLGVGINLSNPKNGFPDEIKDIAISLNNTTSKELLIEEFLTNLFRYLKRNNTDEILSTYRSYSMMCGKTIQYVKNSVCLSGTVEFIDENYYLVVRRRDGNIDVLNSGKIKIID